ncbi:hypothetical protein, partial [Vibrio sp. TRT 2004]|uniref:hypothetical protein n=1 Tax=Vibrio sp. TRT 2004 TaxID=3418506 RepID=UPI003CE83E66
AGSVMNALASWLAWMMQRVVFMRSFFPQKHDSPSAEKVLGWSPTYGYECFQYQCIAHYQPCDFAR